MTARQPKPVPPVESAHVQDLLDLLVIAQRRKWEREGEKQNA